MATVDELLDQADELVQQHEFRRAAELRVQALGTKPYPVLICPHCFALTGWRDTTGTCLECWARRREHNWNEPLPDARARLDEKPVPLMRRVKRTLGVGTARDRAREWLSRVEPDDTGPIEPEEGWEIEVPVKYDIADPEGGAHRVVRFDVQSYRFEYAAWRACDTSRGGKPRRLVPREFPASLPIEQLAEAWADFVAEVAEHNRRVWRTETERRALTSAPGEDERGTADLLG